MESGVNKSPAPPALATNTSQTPGTDINTDTLHSRMGEAGTRQESAVLPELKILMEVSAIFKICQMLRTESSRPPYLYWLTEFGVTTKKYYLIQLIWNEIQKK